MDCEIDITALRLRTSGLDATVVLVASSGCLFRVIYTKQHWQHTSRDLSWLPTWMLQRGFPPFPKGFKFQPSTPRKHLCLKRLGRWFQWSRSWGPWQQLRNVVVASLGSAAVQLPNENSTDFYESLHMFGFKKIQNLVPKKLGLPSIKETKQRWSCGWRKQTHDQGY